MNAPAQINLHSANGWAVLPASLKCPDGKPRFNLNFPINLVTDPGAVHLIANEYGPGYEPSTRDVIERTLRSGDLFVDVGAHWGFFSLLAATHHSGAIDVVAFEPELANAAILSENVARNKTSNVTVVCAACGDENKLAPLIMNSTMGHSIQGADGRLNARIPSRWVPVVTLDSALSTLQKQLDQRIILKIDAEGFEPNIIAGARKLLQAGRIALIVWECGGAFFEGARRAAMAQMVGFLDECGFRHLRAPANSLDEPSVGFDSECGYYGNVFSFLPRRTPHG